MRALSCFGFGQPTERDAAARFSRMVHRVCNDPRIEGVAGSVTQTQIVKNSLLRTAVQAQLAARCAHCSSMREGTRIRAVASARLMPSREHLPTTLTTRCETQLESKTRRSSTNERKRCPTAGPPMEPLKTLEANVKRLQNTAAARLDGKGRHAVRPPTKAPAPLPACGGHTS